MNAVASSAAPPTDPGRLLKIEGVRKTFPGVVALDGVDFDVRAGEVHALLGANGAGKSTLIKLVSGLYRPDAGKISINGTQVDLRSPHEARELGVSVIYQDFALVPDLSVAENIFLGREILTPLGLVDWKRTHAEARSLLDRVGVAIPATVRVRDLGTGQRQLVEIAKALGVNARLLILDEPTAALSQGESERLFALVRDLARSGVGMIYVSHRLEEIANLVDRVTVLRDGRLVGTYPAREIDRAKVVSLITGHELADRRREAPSSRQPAEAVLETRGLTRTGEFRELSLVVRRGEVAVMTGLVGSGRTEFLETLFGARPAESGEILLRGRPARLRQPSDAIKAGIALIPEDRRGQGIAVIMPVFVNITLASLGRFVRAGVLSLRREMAHARKMIARLAIKTAHPRLPANTLSGGNQQKVVLAKWLSTSAEIYLFDEPTQGVDVGAKDEIHRLIGELARGGKAVLVSSSDLEEALAIADRVIAFRKGRIVGEFAKGDVTARAVMEAIVHGDIT
ncbi:MAG: sugar ABC transporter ATP-binding protein [Pseudomonadota bacterium]